jgi:uncharacterized protein YgiM (DUF1202 family)
VPFLFFTHKEIAKYEQYSMSNADGFKETLMRRYKLLFLALFMLSCSLTTPPAAPGAVVKPVNNISLTTPTQIPSSVPSTMSSSCMVTAESLNLRSCAGLSCSVIAWLSKGDVLLIRGKWQEWIEVESPNGQNGWVHSKYCGGKP